MSTGTNNFYGYYHLYLLNDTVELGSDTLYVALLTSAYTPSPNGDQKWADISANEIAAGNGYSTGGLALTGVAFTLSGGAPPALFSADNSIWTSSGGGSISAWRYWVLRSGATHNGVVQPLICYGYGDNTPADVPATPTGKTLNIDWNNGNIFQA